MRIVKTKQDIVILRRAEVLPTLLLVHVENYFNQLRVELFDETLRQCMVVADPSTDKVDGSFSLSRQKHTSPFTIVI